jgi:hypothetical protein
MTANQTTRNYVNYIGKYIVNFLLCLAYQFRFGHSFTHIHIYNLKTKYIFIIK